MKPSDRLMGLEAISIEGIPGDVIDDMRWLINRVKRLTTALEKCAKVDTWHTPCIICSRTIIEHGNYIARKALEDEA